MNETAPIETAWLAAAIDNPERDSGERVMLMAIRDRLAKAEAVSEKMAATYRTDLAQLTARAEKAEARTEEFVDGRRESSSDLGWTAARVESQCERIKKLERELADAEARSLNRKRALQLLTKQLDKPLEDMTEPELRDQMQLLCLAIQAVLPKGTGFIVLAASFDGRIAQYASNTEREAAEEWMLETLLRWKRKDDTPR